MKNITIADLKEIIEDLPNDIPVIIPVADDDCNRVKVPENHIVIDFDIPDKKGIHLHYIYK